ncbi:hypothetical protein FOXYSP1_03379 [Fusarium oxysporum f. sp. phaseoli]
MIEAPWYNIGEALLLFSHPEAFHASQVSPSPWVQLHLHPELGHS